MPGVSIQSHTRWRTNLLKEHQRLAPKAFRRFAVEQISGPRRVLHSLTYSVAHCGAHCRMAVAMPPSGSTSSTA
jgi:hypothetical protein